MYPPPFPDLIYTSLSHFFCVLKQHILDTNAGKQLSSAATDV
jgi:hypothetical protein